MSLNLSSLSEKQLRAASLWPLTWPTLGLISGLPAATDLGLCLGGIYRLRLFEFILLAAESIWPHVLFLTLKTLPKLLLGELYWILPSSLCQHCLPNIPVSTELIFTVWFHCKFSCLGWTRRIIANYKACYALSCRCVHCYRHNAFCISDKGGWFHRRCCAKMRTLVFPNVALWEIFSSSSLFYFSFSPDILSAFPFLMVSGKVICFFNCMCI